MGCGSSREAYDLPASHGETATTSSGNRSRVAATSALNQTPLSQANNVYSPASSRAPLTTTASLPADSAVSSPRQSSVGHHQLPQTNDPLSEHYNVPLSPPKPWKSRSRIWTASQLRKERQDFFDTRVTGQKEVWEALRQVAECIRDGEIETAQGILNAVNCTLPTGRLEDGCYDERGNLYKFPSNILTDPTNIAAGDENVDGDTVVGVPAGSKVEPDGEKLDGDANLMITDPDGTLNNSKGKAVVDADAVKVKCRLSNTGNDVIVMLGRSKTVATLAGRLKEEASVPPATKIRIFYLGREMKEKKTLADQDVQEGHVLNIFIAGIPT